MRAIDGRSLWATLRGEHPAEWADETFSELVDVRTGESDHPNLPSRMIRSGPWKLWVHHDSEELPPVLFNLAEDPGETADLGADPEHAEIRERLLSRVYADWDPEGAGRQARRLTEDHRVLGKYGEAVRPASEDSLPVPEADVEADIELL
jgi:arylsulfatase A-like enzyme